MVTHHIKNRAMCAPRIMQVCNAIAETGSKMQQRHGRFILHAPITIRSASTNALK